jgi:subtilisin family serine protease
MHFLSEMFYSVVVIAAFGCVHGVHGASDQGHDVLADRILVDKQGKKFIKDSYIIKLKFKSASIPKKSEVLAKANTLLTTHGGKVGQVYTTVFQGFSATLTPEAADALANDATVELIQPNRVVNASFIDSNTASWGLDRIDQCTATSLDSTLDTADLGTTVSATGGYAYVIDSGINPSHKEFTSTIDATCSRNFVSFDGTTSSDWRDGYGHGSHVAGTMCGQVKFGVARNCRKLCAVRVLDDSGSGTTEDVIAGIDFVAANAPPGSVVNMSLGGPIDAALNDAVNAAVGINDVVFVVAAGNDSDNACNASPASAEGAITVGATDISDTRAYFSNYGAYYANAQMRCPGSWNGFYTNFACFVDDLDCTGNCVDIFGPGVDIKSAWIGSNSATNTISGTSMASPHIAGLAMLFREQNPELSAGDIRNLMLSRASRGVVQDALSENSHLAVVPTLDCNPCNDDGVCDQGESNKACPLDNCPAVCGDGRCDALNESCFDPAQSTPHPQCESDCGICPIYLENGVPFVVDDLFEFEPKVYSLALQGIGNVACTLSGDDPLEDTDMILEFDKSGFGCASYNGGPDQFCEAYPPPGAATLLVTLLSYVNITSPLTLTCTQEETYYLVDSVQTKVEGLPMDKEKLFVLPLQGVVGPVECTMEGSDPDADLYVRFDSSFLWDCLSESPTSNEYCYAVPPLFGASFAIVSLYAYTAVTSPLTILCAHGTFEPTSTPSWMPYDTPTITPSTAIPTLNTVGAPSGHPMSIPPPTKAPSTIKKACEISAKCRSLFMDGFYFHENIFGICINVCATFSPGLWKLFGWGCGSCASIKNGKK